MRGGAGNAFSKHLARADHRRCGRKAWDEELVSIALVYGRNVFATGVERYARTLEAFLRGLGVDVVSVPLTRREIRIAGRPVGGFVSLWLARMTGTRGDHEIVHALDPAVATRRTDVVTVHDLVVETFPHWYQRDLASRLDWGFIRRYARSVPWIIAVSEVTRQDVIAHWGVPPERVVTIHSGIDHEKFRPREGPTPHLAEGRPNLVYVGDDNPRKNVLLAVRAVAELQERHGISARLLRIGANRFPDVRSAYLREATALGVDLVEPGFLGDEELIATLTKAHAFVWPTVAEGFGFPPIEAMACGTTVVALDTPINREVCGDAARYHANDAADAADALWRAIEGPTPTADLRAQAARFDWTRAAEQTRAVYERVRGR